METRVQFRVSEETKKLAQQLAESQGATLSEACRSHVEQLAEQQRKAMAHDEWLASQVEQAFQKLESGRAHFLSTEEAHADIEQRKAAVRARYKK